MATAEWSYRFCLALRLKASTGARSQATQGAALGVTGCCILFGIHGSREPGASSGSRQNARRRFPGPPQMLRTSVQTVKCAEGDPSGQAGSSQGLWMAGIGLGVVCSSAAAAYLFLRKASPESRLLTHEDHDVRRAAQVVLSLKLDASGLTPAKASGLRSKRFTELVKVSKSTSREGIKVENLEDAEAKQALALMSGDPEVSLVSRAEFIAGTTVASLLTARLPAKGRAPDMSAVAFEMFAALDSDCDAELSASEVGALRRALCAFGLIDRAAVGSDDIGMGITEFNAFCRSQLKLEKLQVK